MLAKLEELQKLQNLRMLIQIQRYHMTMTRDIAVTLWSSYDGRISPNWVVQIHNALQFLQNYDVFLEGEIHNISQFLVSCDLDV